MSSDEYYCKEKQDHLLFLPSCCSNKQASCVEFFPGAIIVGAGPSGLATAACLQQQHNIPSMIFEKSEGIASLWKQKTYDRLHLHLPKQFCELPLFPFKDDLPTYPTRGQFVEYLESYTAHFKLQPKFCQSVDLAAFDARSGLWNVQTSTSCCGIKQEYRARWLVVASGENADPVIPNFKGANDYRSNGAGALFHSSQYRNGAEYAGKKVLVVGCGNTGMEIALDLVNFGASPSLVVRSPVSLLPFLGNRMAVMHWESERERVDSHRCWMRGSFAKSSFYRRHRCSMIQGFLRVFSWGSIGVECWFEVFASLSSHQGVNNRMFEKKSVCEFFHKMLIGVERLWRSCECWRLIQKTKFSSGADWIGICVFVLQTHIPPREILGKSTFLVAMQLMKTLPVWLTDMLLVSYTYLTLGDTACHGIPRPAEGPMMLKDKCGKTPILDVGTFAKIKSGQVKVNLVALNLTYYSTPLSSISTSWLIIIIINLIFSTGSSCL